MVENIKEQINLNKSTISKFIQNDFAEIKRDRVEKKIFENIKFSYSYIILLVCASVVATIGLLTNSTPVVIGGMIISPLMWPLLGISTGVYFDKPLTQKNALILLFLSIVITLVSSIFITTLSPIKLINEEILARTNPTVLDILIALFAGSIASLGLLQRKISDSLSGVAIATSLMPPLCVSGIGIALKNPQIATGGFLLFLANIVSIIFVSLLIFSIFNIGRVNRFSRIKSRGFIVIALIFVITSVPLFFYLQRYAFRNVAIVDVQATLESQLRQISPSIHLGSVQTSVENINNEETVDVLAEIRIPNNIKIDYLQKQSLIKSLQNKLNRSVNLNLVLSNTVSIVSEEDQALEFTRQKISQTILEEVIKFGSDVTIENIQAQYGKNENIWNVQIVLNADSDIVVTFEDKNILQKTILEKAGVDTNIDIKILPVLALKSGIKIQNQQVLDKIKLEVKESLKKLQPQAEISEVRLIAEGDDKTIVNVEVKLPAGLEITSQDVDKIEFLIEYIAQNEQNSILSNKEIILQVSTIEKRIIKSTRFDTDKIKDIIEANEEKETENNKDGKNNQLNNPVLEEYKQTDKEKGQLEENNQKNDKNQSE